MEEWRAKPQCFGLVSVVMCAHCAGMLMYIRKENRKGKLGDQSCLVFVSRYDQSNTGVRQAAGDLGKAGERRVAGRMGVRMVAGVGIAAAGVDLPPVPAASPTHQCCCCRPTVYSAH